jgi:hypothetical protein
MSVSEVAVRRLLSVLAVVGEHLVLEEPVDAAAYLRFLEAHARHVGVELVEAPEAAPPGRSRLAWAVRRTPGLPQGSEQNGLRSLERDLTREQLHCLVGEHAAGDFDRYKARMPGL